METPDNNVEHSEFKLMRLVLQGKRDDFLSDDTPIANTTWKTIRCDYAVHPVASEDWLRCNCDWFVSNLIVFVELVIELIN